MRRQEVEEEKEELIHFGPDEAFENNSATEKGTTMDNVIYKAFNPVEPKIPNGFFG